MQPCKLLIFFVTGMTWAQAPGEVIDPHENPAVQNAPEGKKDTPSADTPAKPGIPPVISPKPSSAKNTAKASPKPKQAEVAAPIADPEEIMLGTWKLVVNKSSFTPGPPPQSEVRTYSRTANGITATTITTLADGKSRTVTFPWQPDGKEYAVTGSDLLDTIRLQRVNNLTAEASLRHGDKIIASERRSLSADGKSMTIVVTDMTAGDRSITATAVYEKQP